MASYLMKGNLMDVIPQKRTTSKGSIYHWDGDEPFSDEWLRINNLLMVWISCRFCHRKHPIRMMKNVLWNGKLGWAHRSCLALKQGQYMPAKTNEAWEAQNEIRHENYLEHVLAQREARQRTDNLTSEEEEFLELSRNEEDI